MRAYLVRRLFLSVIVIFILTAITFILAYKVPGDPARMIAGQHAKIEQVEAVRHQLGLDKPVIVQYYLYLGRLIHGDLGISLKTRNEVATDIRQFFAATLELTTYAMALTILVGISLGLFSALNQNNLGDHLSRLFSLFGVSVPIYWLGLILQLVFGSIPSMPIQGRVSVEIDRAFPLHLVTGIYTLDALISGNWVFLRDALLHLILPTICMAYPALVIVTRMTRATVLEVLENDYVRTARAKGLNSIRVIFVHALPNAMLPILTIIGLSYGTLLSGSFLIEQVFSWPGLGRYAIRAAQNADYPAIMGVTILIALIFSFVNIAIDMLYGVFDPRIRNRTT